MKRKKTSPDFESIRREIARRLQAGLPLAGMIAATTLLCGCNERAGRVPEGSVERDPSLCEQHNEQPKPKTAEETAREIERLKAQLNNTNESMERTPDGMSPLGKTIQEKKAELEKAQKAQADKSNRTNETVDPASTMGRFPAKKEDK